MRLVLIGPPGSGKGTQAHLLTERMGLTYIGTGDVLRSAISHSTPTGLAAEPHLRAGELVPDALVNQVVAELFERPDRPTRYVLDGYPRTVAQARWFDDFLRRQGQALDAAVELAISDEQVVWRLGGRWVCPKPGCPAPIYHRLTHPPRQPGICDLCSSGLVQREDDKEETIRHRLAVYHSAADDLIDYYRRQGKLRTVSAREGPEAIYQHLQRALPPGATD